MNTKMIIAASALASLVLSTGAFAAGDSYPVAINQQAQVSQQAPVGAGGYVSTQSTQAYPGFSPALAATGLSNATVAQNNGSESTPQSPNALPKNFEVGTQDYVDGQIQGRWFAQQAQHRFALLQARQITQTR